MLICWTGTSSGRGWRRSSRRPHLPESRRQSWNAANTRSTDTGREGIHRHGAGSHSAPPRPTPRPRSLRVAQLRPSLALRATNTPRGPRAIGPCPRTPHPKNHRLRRPTACVTPQPCRPAGWAHAASEPPSSDPPEPTGVPASPPRTPRNTWPSLRRRLARAGGGGGRAPAVRDPAGGDALDAALDGGAVTFTETPLRSRALSCVPDVAVPPQPRVVLPAPALATRAGVLGCPHSAPACRAGGVAAPLARHPGRTHNRTPNPIA